MNEQQAINLLRDPKTIRERSMQLFDRALQNNSSFFAIDESKLTPCCEFVLSLVDKESSLSAIPFHSRWRHFSVGNIDRVKLLTTHDLFPKTSREQGRAYYELVLLSVLLDAGAGSQWRYFETSSEKTWGRSEGLAIASIDMFIAGHFSSSISNPLQADSEGLKQVCAEKLASAMQVTDENPLVGLDGRASLVNSLADVITNNPQVFSDNRLGALYDYVIDQALINEMVIDAAKVLAIVLETFSPIWPGRVSLAGENLGDVWQHSAIVGEGASNGLIPFHKLSQWITYSLLEPLQWQGYTINGLEQMTGLAEYRNGGLLIDTDVITIKQPSLRTNKQASDSEAIIEWRALTICLLDRLWQRALELTGSSSQEFPLVSFLQAGTWKAGRLMAKKNNPEGNPPITLLSDGTVF